MRLSKIKIIPLLILILNIFTNVMIKCDLSADNVVVAINCGGDSYKDNKGIIYEKVNFYFFKFFNE
jgi:hypothetical protein